MAEQVVELLAEFYVLYAKSIAFPELAIPTIVLAKRGMKKSKNAKLNNALAVLVGKLEANSKWVQERRSKVEFAPEKIVEAESFCKEVEWEKTPLGGYVVSQRKVREERMKMLEESAREDREREKVEREGSEDEQEMVVEHSDSEGEDDEEMEDDDDE